MRSLVKGTTNYSAYFYIVQDASATSPGEPVTGLLFSDIETGGSASYCRSGAVRVDLTLITQTVAGAHADGGFVEVDATNMPGFYRCDYPDLAFATGVDEVTLQLVVASANNAVAAPIKIQLTGIDLQDATGAGISRLDAAITTRLAPTVAGRTLDVTVLGSAGIDWGNLENPGTTVDLSATDIQLVDTATANTDMRGTDSALLASTFSTVFAGITVLAEWLGLIAGKQVADATAKTEIQATGAGSGTYDEATDSQEAIRDTAPLGTAMRGTDSALLASSAPTNFSSLLIDGSGLVSLAATGLDAIVSTAVGMVEIAKAIWDRALTGATHNLSTSAGRRLRNLGALVLHDGTAQAGANNSITLDAGASSIDDFYNHARVVISVGAGVEQERIITDYDGTTKIATTAPAWVTNPDGTSEFEIVPAQVHSQTNAGGYDDNQVFMSPSGSTGTQLFVDGISTNPIDDGQMANAKTVADAVGVKTFSLAPASSVVLGQTFTSYVFQGRGFTVALGGRDISGSRFARGIISGIGTGAIRPLFNSCLFDAATTLPGTTLLNCRIDATITLADAATYVLDNCFAVDGNAVLDFGSALSQDVGLTHWSGAIEVQQMGVGGTDVLTINGDGVLTINANCTGGTVRHRGDIVVVDNSGGSVTVIAEGSLLAATFTAMFAGVTVIAEWLGLIAGKQTGDATARTEIRATGAGSGTFDETTDSQEAIRDIVALASVATEARLAELDPANLPSDIDAILLDTDTTIPALIAALNDIAAADVLTQALAALDTAIGASPTADSVNQRLKALDEDWEDGGRLDALMDRLIVEIDTATGEPGQGAPGVSLTRGQKTDLLYKWARNGSDQSATLWRGFADDGTTVDHKRTISDDATTFAADEMVSGP